MEQRAATKGFISECHGFKGGVARIIGLDVFKQLKKEFQKGDVIIAVNGNEVNYWDEFTSIVKGYDKDSITMVIERSGQVISKTIPLTNGKVGVFPLVDKDEFVHIDEYSFLVK